MPVQQSTQVVLTLIIESPLQVATTSLPAGVQGQAYSQQLLAIGGNPPYTWSATGLPTGLTCSSGGLISGISSISGSFSVVITVTDTPL